MYASPLLAQAGTALLNISKKKKKFRKLLKNELEKKNPGFITYLLNRERSCPGTVIKL
jgi:hypothetical protein